MKQNIETIADIVRKASSLMQTYGMNISQKNGYSNIVTTSDLAVQDFLCRHLAEILPGSGFLCEENGINNVTNEYTWIIDPIDGTTNFSRGISEHAICVGLKQNNDMIAGVVYLPLKEMMFTAEKGKGAYLNGKRITVSDKPFEDSLLCTALPVYKKEYADICSEIILNVFKECNDIRRFGSCATELCFLAMGQCELYFEYFLSPWDFAAASLILTEAGGYICDLKGAPLDFESPSGVVAANNRANLDRLLKIGDFTNKLSNS